MRLDLPLIMRNLTRDAQARTPCFAVARELNVTPCLLRATSFWSFLLVTQVDADLVLYTDADVMFR